MFVQQGDITDCPCWLTHLAVDAALCSLFCVRWENGCCSLYISYSPLDVLLVRTFGCTYFLFLSSSNFPFHFLDKIHASFNTFEWRTCHRSSYFCGRCAVIIGDLDPHYASLALLFACVVSLYYLLVRVSVYSHKHGTLWPSHFASFFGLCDFDCVDRDP